MTQLAAKRHPTDADPPIEVVGIGADGFSSLNEAAQFAILHADIVIGSWRQLNLLPEGCRAERRPWPSPLLPSIEPLFQEFIGKHIVVLASGDPMFHGIGTTLIRIFGVHRVHIHSAPSSISLACARLGWPVDATPVVSLMSKPVASMIPIVDSGQPFMVLCRDETSVGEIASLLVSLGHEAAKLIVLSDLGSADEQQLSGTAILPPKPVSSLNILAIIPNGPTHSCVPGLPDSEYETDGQLTKQDIRALTISALAPKDGETLWDIGGGTGSIAIEAMRAVPSLSAYCFEINEERRTRIARNAVALGVPTLQVLGSAPKALLDAPTPDVIFIGGGITSASVFETAWAALPLGGRLVANAVTIESEQKLWQLRKQYGGTMIRMEISHEHPVGAFTTMKPALPVVQWRVLKETN
ncbi:bifunctional cobalt-precorrin-7 (C(5))-methyltransferase/cobalt-precorrin-6B (C(15))-methyltransferase [Corynebacterium freiburgense]|uniref:bifunctional cobalt-precorrin-7 (C(5))-methyltransferase/cobalt-precorrin-6B (C(15))-methyltransferase n=1 Tax=Corynebacterium freiburgense TaxID=556548 RepID=UPI00042A5E65|nr:bifunctional cobalt-precorrin-7 (C(5))-methyltransferase/cobalt-precorrin-6B (C(15))-methyltransferase [Corynebacterium freiburgense]WJZ02626.1 Precorrin-6Y C(5,15)-methyltransferase [decarboxylating] [Corynebacterium freiburgense]